jgi:hypothetical protein
MIQQDLRNIQSYILGVVGLAIALFIPFAFLILKIFKANPLSGALFLGIFMPLIALILGIMGLVKSSKQFTKSAKILNIFTIIISILLILFVLYIFIKYKSLVGVI